MPKTCGEEGCGNPSLRSSRQPWRVGEEEVEVRRVPEAQRGLGCLGEWWRLAAPAAAAYYPHPMGPPPPFLHPPGPFGFYPHPQQPYPQLPPYNPQGQQFNRQGGRPRGMMQGGRGRQNQFQQQMQKSSKQQSNQSLQNQSGDNLGSQQDQQQKKDQMKTEGGKYADDKSLNIIYYNCGDPGHYSTACIKPRVCFVCFRKDHQADMCPRWKEPTVAV